MSDTGDQPQVQRQDARLNLHTEPSRRSMSLSQIMRGIILVAILVYIGYIVYLCQFADEFTPDWRDEVRELESVQVELPSTTNNIHNMWKDDLDQGRVGVDHAEGMFRHTAAINAGSNSTGSLSKEEGMASRMSTVHLHHQPHELCKAYTQDVYAADCV